MIFLICIALDNIFLLFILSNKSFVCVNFYLTLNLIKKFIKHNHVKLVKLPISRY
jgi:hypothetical protein